MSPVKIFCDLFFSDRRLIGYPRELGEQGRDMLCPQVFCKLLQKLSAVGILRSQLGFILYQTQKYGFNLDKSHTAAPQQIINFKSHANIGALACKQIVVLSRAEKSRPVQFA